MNIPQGGVGGCVPAIGFVSTLTVQARGQVRGTSAVLRRVVGDQQQALALYGGPGKSDCHGQQHEKGKLRE